MDNTQQPLSPAARVAELKTRLATMDDQELTSMLIYTLPSLALGDQQQLSMYQHALYDVLAARLAR